MTLLLESEGDELQSQQLLCCHQKRHFQLWSCCIDMLIDREIESLATSLDAYVECFFLEAYLFYV